MNEMIYVDPSAVEAEEFVSWLNEKGHQAKISYDANGVRETESDEVNALWEQYCSE